MCSHVKIIVNLHATESRWPNRLPHAPARLPPQLWEELELQASKDDEAAAKWLELVSSCGFLFPPNKASIFSLRAPSAPHLHYRGRRAEGGGVSQNEFAHIWHIILQLLWARWQAEGGVWGSLGCGLWVAVMLPKDKLSTSCCDFDGLFECLRVCEAV